MLLLLFFQSVITCPDVAAMASKLLKEIPQTPSIVRDSVPKLDLSQESQDRIAIGEIWFALRIVAGFDQNGLFIAYHYATMPINANFQLQHCS